MSFGNSAIFPFPAVQYIPMMATDIQNGRLQNPNAALPQSQLIVGDDLVKWRFMLKQDYGIELPEKFTTDSFPVLAINLKVSNAKYRAYFVTMIGRKNYGYYQLFTLPRHYFYKNKLYFDLFDESTGERLAKCSLFMPKLA